MTEIFNLEDEKIVGGYNDLPPEFKEISEKEFAQSMFFSYSPMKVEFRQARLIKDSEMHLQSMRIYWFYNYTYIVIWNDYWAGKVHFAKGQLCEHAFECKNLGRCLNKYTCKKCGFTEEIDSSD